VEKVEELRREVTGVENVIDLVDRAVVAVQEALQKNTALARTGDRRSPKTPTAAYHAVAKALSCAETALLDVRRVLTRNAGSRRDALFGESAAREK